MPIASMPGGVRDQIIVDATVPSIREFLVQEVIKGTVRTTPVVGGRIAVTATDFWSRGGTPLG